MKSKKMKNEEFLAEQASKGRAATDHLYEDIIDSPHYEPKHHPRMSMWNRAAQFAPFAALTGYDTAIQESGRLTEHRIDLGESGNEELNRKMELLISKLPEHPTVTIEYFLPDSHKSGGSYQSYIGNVKRIDEYEKCIEFTDGKRIPLDAIKEIITLWPRYKN